MSSFEWDQAKDQENQKKPNVSFSLAQLAFKDPNRGIAQDLSHSHNELRYYCFGKIDAAIITVRFTLRSNIIGIILLELVIGVRGKKFMSKKIVKYTNEPIGDIKIVPDFLPAPDQLIMKDDTVKVTLSLTKSSIDFFKYQAEKNHTQYQKMIRVLLEQYASHYKN